MAIRCPCCSREFDVTLFEFGRTVTCVCGNVVSLQHAGSKNFDSAIAQKSRSAKVTENKKG
jgi:hypothetical protein